MDQSITKRPDARQTLHFEIGIHLDPAALFYAGHEVERRVRRRPRGPDQRVARDAFAVAQFDFMRSDGSDFCLGVDFDSGHGRGG